MAEILNFSAARNGWEGWLYILLMLALEWDEFHVFLPEY